jgi:plastocyanin
MGAMVVGIDPRPQKIRGLRARSPVGSRARRDALESSRGTAGHAMRDFPAMAFVLATLGACASRVVPPDARADALDAPDAADASVSDFDSDIEKPDFQRPPGPNGCNPSRVTDMTAAAMPTIVFSGSDYVPPCVRIHAGQSVTFLPSAAAGSSFNLHPLSPGLLVDGVPTPQADNPITRVADGTGPHTFTFPTQGLWGFYCETHFGGGMYGGVEVVP